MSSRANNACFSLLCLLALLCAPAAARGGEPAPLRPVMQAWTAEYGSAHLTDSYLSPLHYSGYSLGLGYERWQAIRSQPERLVMRLDLRATLCTARNPARNATMRDLALRASWAMMRRWRLPCGFTVAAGGEVCLDAGAGLLARNGNNPANAHAALTIGPAAAAFWSTSVARRPLTLSLRPSMPLIGAFFSPQYGELYYEMYLGDASGLVHCAWPGSRLAFDVLAAADWRLGATALRLGYRLTTLEATANHLVTRRFTHSLVVGVAFETVCLPAGAPNVISAY